MEHEIRKENARGLHPVKTKRCWVCERTTPMPTMDFCSGKCERIYEQWRLEANREFGTDAAATVEGKDE